MIMTYHKSLAASLQTMAQALSLGDTKTLRDEIGFANDIVYLLQPELGPMWARTEAILDGIATKID
jgi:hypothetical protein